MQNCSTHSKVLLIASVCVFKQKILINQGFTNNKLLSQIINKKENRPFVGGFDMQR